MADCGIGSVSAGSAIEGDRIIGNGSSKKYWRRNCTVAKELLSLRKQRLPPHS